MPIIRNFLCQLQRTKIPTEPNGSPPCLAILFFSCIKDYTHWSKLRDRERSDDLTMVHKVYKERTHIVRACVCVCVCVFENVGKKVSLQKLQHSLLSSSETQRPHFCLLFPFCKNRKSGEGLVYRDSV